MSVLASRLFMFIHAIEGRHRIFEGLLNEMMLLANSDSFVSERNTVYSATKNCAEGSP